MNEKDVYWVVVAPGGFAIPETLAWKRRDSIAKLLEFELGSWAECRKDGYKVVNVNLRRAR